MSDLDMRTLTHVAILHDGRLFSLPRPYRHHHVIRIIRYLDDTVECVDGTQGFLNAMGRFLTRDQAKVDAFASGQINKTISTTLTSEDLW